MKIFLLVIGALLTLTLSGCYELERKVTWSSDGKTAAVIGTDGLRLCEIDGEFSDVLVNGARLAEWVDIGGQEHLVALRYRSVDSWQAIEKQIVEPLRTALVAEGDAVVEKLRTGAKWREQFGDLSGFNRSSDWATNDPWEQATKLYVLAQLSEQEWKKVGKEVEAEELRARFGEIVVYPKLTGFLLGEPKSISRAFIGSFDELRISPTGDHAAFVIAADTPANGLWIVALDGEQVKEPTELRIEAGKVGFFPDWTPDGRSLVYTKPDRTGADDSAAEVSLGHLVSRQVIGEAGELLKDGAEERKAWLLFYEHGRVRCLSDGRILCSAIEANFPVTDADLPQSDQLYQFDPARSATLTRVLPAQTLASLPDMVALYEVSPDGRNLVVADSEMSQVFMVDIASGELNSLQEEDLSDISWMPSWTPDGQLCFRGRLPVEPAEGESPTKEPVEVLLWDGENYQAISKDWPDDLRRGLDLETKK